MKRIAAWSRKRSLSLFFYACLSAGNWLFAGPGEAALMVLLLVMFNSILKSPAGKILKEGSELTSLVVRSLLSLGLFPLVWLACRAPAKTRDLPLLAVLLLGGFLFSLRVKKPGGEAFKKNYWAIAVALLLVVVLTWLPFSRIGFPLEGKYAYRAYFSSDYLKHFSVVEALNEGSLPPPNLYFQGQPLHYYWLPYATPAAIARLTGSTAKSLFAFSFSVNFLFLLMLLVLAYRMNRRRKWLPFLPLLFIMLSSLEGFYLWAVRSRFSLSGYFQAGRDTNIDGLTRWLWNLPQIDTFLRTLLYTPQHLLSLAFLVLFLYFYSLEKRPPLAMSLCLALSLSASFFVGGILLLSWALYVAVQEGSRLIRRKQSLTRFGLALAGHFLLPLLVLGLSLALNMVAFSGSGMFIKALTPGQMAILLGLNLGFLLIGGIWGLAASPFPGRAFYALLLAVSLVLVLFVRISNFESDISLKAGLIVILLLALLTCRMDGARLSERFVLLLALLIILPGLPTLVLDIKNSADIHNRRFTSYVSFEEMRMLEWIRANIPAERTVQNFPAARTWNLSAISAFSGRQMVVGDRLHGQIFQVSSGLYQKRIEDLSRVLAGLPASRDELRGLGVDYLFWGEDESRHFKFTPDLPVAKRVGQTILFSLAR